MSKDPSQDAKRDKLNARLEDMAAESKHLTESIPAKWTSERKAFVKLKKAATKARRIYRRNVDDAYGAIIETSKVIASAGDLAALQGQLGKVADDIAGKSIKDAQAILKKLTVLVRAVPGTSKITKELSGARRALRKKKNGEEKARKKLAKAQKIFNTELAWREKAEQSVKPGLDGFEAAIRNTIGIRLQSRLPHDQALEVAACKSNPHDLTLSF